MAGVISDREKVFFNCLEEDPTENMTKEELEAVNDEILADMGCHEVKEADAHCMLYCEENDELYESSLACMLDYEHNPEQFSFKPFRLWTTTKESIHLDAATIIEEACEDLHKDAVYSCNVKELQKLLDAWCNEQSGTTSVLPNKKEYVKIHWEA